MFKLSPEGRVGASLRRSGRETTWAEGRAYVKVLSQEGAGSITKAKRARLGMLSQWWQKARAEMQMATCKSVKHLLLLLLLTSHWIKQDTRWMQREQEVIRGHGTVHAYRKEWGIQAMDVITLLHLCFFFLSFFFFLLLSKGGVFISLGIWLDLRNADNVSLYAIKLMFLLYSSMIFNTCIDLCNHYCK